MEKDSIEFNLLFMEKEEVEDLESFQPNILTKHCQFCRGTLDQNSKLINSNGNLYHTRCFVCAQCFQPFKVMKGRVKLIYFLE